MQAKLVGPMILSGPASIQQTGFLGGRLAKPTLQSSRDALMKSDGEVWFRQDRDRKVIASNYVKRIFNFQDDTSKIYARLWQFETWLRRMVYIELRAMRGDEWKKGLRPISNAIDEDKALLHMQTSEENDLSYAQLWQLLELIDNNWDCFKKYFPPKKIWKAKSQEVSQIRHRVAHFRTSHSDDLQRIEQFLRDIDQGFWKFCTSYNDEHPVLPQYSDIVTQHFLHLDPLPWGEINPNEWARVGFVNKSLVVGMVVNMTSRPWFSASKEDPKGVGELYDITLLSGERVFDVPRFLESTLKMHHHFVTLDFDRRCNSIRLVLPAVLGSEKVIELVENAEKWARNSATRSQPMRSHDEIASKWPEYVLSADDPLAYLSPDMPCSFFNV